MRKRVVWLVFLLMTSFISAQEISLDYANQTWVGEEFNISVSLSGFEENVYDAKIEILHNTSNIAKRFWENEWKSTYYWMNGAINTSQSNEKTFLLKISEGYDGEAEVKVKVRNGNFNKEFEGHKIWIIPSQQSQNSNQSQNNNQQNHSQISNNHSNAAPDPPEIELDIDWNEEDIVNGDEFEAEIKADNLEDKKYDARVWIEYNGKIISQAYNNEEGKWKSGKYYINGIFNGPGTESEKASLRISEDNKDFEGNANIYFKLRDGKQIDKKIKVLKKEEQQDNNKSQITKENKNSSPAISIKSKENSSEKITGQAIYLGKAKKNENTAVSGKVAYESKNEAMKKYSIIGFAALCLIICVLVIKRKIR